MASYFDKSHPIFQNVIKPKAVGLMGVTYETGDSYATVWCETMDDALETRKIVNQIVGYNVCSKPVAYDKYDETNPFMQSCVGIELVSEEIAKRNEEFDGDNYKAAIAACLRAGIEIRN